MAGPALLGRMALGSVSSGFRGASALASRVSTGIQGSARGFVAGARSAGFSSAPGIAGAYSRMAGLVSRGFRGSGSGSGGSADPTSEGIKQQVIQQVETNRKLETLNRQTQGVLNTQRAVLLQSTKQTQQTSLLGKKFEAFSQQFSRVADAMGLSGAPEETSSSGFLGKLFGTAAAVGGAIYFNKEI
jgi:hypothetical protein